MANLLLALAPHKRLLNLLQLPQFWQVVELLQPRQYQESLRHLWWPCTLLPLELPSASCPMALQLLLWLLWPCNDVKSLGWRKLTCGMDDENDIPPVYYQARACTVNPSNLTHSAFGIPDRPLEFLEYAPA